MVTATESKHEQLDLDTISEYIREPKSRSHELSALTNKEISTQVVAKKTTPLPALFAADDISQPSEPDVLETLWPGIHHHHDFAHTIKRKTPVFYLIAGFAAGIVVVSLVVWFFSMLSTFFTHNNVFSSGLSANKTASTESASVADGNKILVPLVPVYEVQEGDTLAAIALRNYKHISPRLLDSICRANNLSDANVLNLGQKITLPEYTPQQ